MEAIEKLATLAFDVKGQLKDREYIDMMKHITALKDQLLSASMIRMIRERYGCEDDCECTAEEMTSKMFSDALKVSGMCKAITILTLEKYQC
jgi:uncharacterized protein YpuA (DUF1002 family)